MGSILPEARVPGSPISLGVEQKLYLPEVFAPLHLGTIAQEYTSSQPLEDGALRAMAAPRLALTFVFGLTPFEAGETACGFKTQI